MTTSFLIVISIILTLQLISICSFLRLCPVAKAGKVSKFYWKYKLLFSKTPRTIECDGKEVSVAEYKDLYVYGNSMKDSKIRNGQQVFVKEYVSEGQKESIDDFPVLVFHIYNMKCQSQFKLRKFVSYVRSPKDTNWEDVFDKLRKRIKMDEKEFVSELQGKGENLALPQEMHILSETFDEDTNTHHYSLHPISSLYGKVVYAV